MLNSPFTIIYDFWGFYFLFTSFYTPVENYLLFLKYALYFLASGTLLIPHDVHLSKSFPTSTVCVKVHPSQFIFLILPQTDVISHIPSPEPSQYFNMLIFCTYHNLPTSHLKFFVNIFKAVIDPFRYPAHSYLFDIWAISVFLFLQLMPCWMNLGLHFQFS